MKKLTTALFLIPLSMTPLSMTTTQAAEQTTQNPMLKTSAWRRVDHLRVLHKGSETSPSAEYAEIQCYKAEFKSTGKTPGVPASVELAAILDKQTNRYFIIDGDHDFYIMDGTHLVGYSLTATGECLWSDDYISGSTPAETHVIEIREKIETSVTAEAVRKKLSERLANRINLNPILPGYFRSEAEAPEGASVSPDIFSIESHGDSIRLRLKKPITHKTAHVEINPKNKTAKPLPINL